FSELIPKSLRQQKAPKKGLLAFQYHDREKLFSVSFGVPLEPPYVRSMSQMGQKRTFRDV
ncbi:MAG: hypothetical protein WCD56_06920, partial [Pseudolabrys sp.]